MSTSPATLVPPTSSRPARSKPFVFCLLGAGYETGNAGVAALASGTINAVRHQFPTAKIFLVDYGYEPKQYAVHCADGMATAHLVNLRYSWRIWLPNNIARLLVVALLMRVFSRNRLLRRHPWLQPICDADLVGSLAGGDSFSDMYGLARLLYVTLPQLLVLWLGKPLVILPQTIGPFESGIGRAIARFILRRADRVYARDAESARLWEAARTSYDMAFVLEPVRPSSCALPPCAAGQSLVGVNVSGLLWRGGYTGANMFGLKADYRATIRAIVEQLIRQGAQVLLVPHVVGDDADGEDDLSAAIALRSACGAISADRLHVLEGQHTHQELKHIIGQCDFFAGSRMHACIAALSQCVPAVGLAYSRKFRGVFATVGVDDLVIDLREEETGAVARLVAQRFGQRGELRARLAQAIPQAQQAVRDLIVAESRSTRANQNGFA